jgi:Gram-negative porin
MRMMRITWWTAEREMQRRRHAVSGTAMRGALLLCVVGCAPMLTMGAAEAASDVELGGYHDAILREAQQSLMRDVDAREADAFRVGVAIEDGPRSALTAFTPRLGGFGASGAARAAALRGPGGGALDPSASTEQVQVGLTERAEIAGWPVDLSATVGMAGGEPATTKEESGFAVGGELAVLGLRLDAGYGQDASALGLEGSRMTAGVAYAIGPIDTRVSYSLVESESMLESNLLTVGSQLTVRPGVVLQGDLAYVEGEERDPATAGLVSLRLNF